MTTHAYTEPTRRKQRRQPNAQSLGAWNEVKPTLNERQKAFFAVLERYPSGKTAKEVAGLLGLPFNAASGRASELKSKGLIRGTGVTRDKGEVLVAVRAEQPEQASLFAVEAA